MTNAAAYKIYRRELNIALAYLTFT